MSGCHARRGSTYRVNRVISTKEESRIFGAATWKTTRSLVPRDDTGVCGRSSDYKQRESINRIQRGEKMLGLQDPDQQDDHEDHQEDSATDIHGPRTSFATHTAGIAP